MIRTAADLMQTKVVTIEASATLHELADLLEENEIHGVPVIDGAGHAIGVVSRTDLVAAVSAGEAPDRPTHHWYAIVDDDVVFTEDEEEFAPETIDTDRTVREIMSADLISARPTTTAGALARKMARHRVHRLLIIERKQLVGILSVTDLLRCLGDYEAVIARASAPRARAQRQKAGSRS
jgi:CBS domain-containing protein